jgi:hypothetical protein
MIFDIGIWICETYGLDGWGRGVEDTANTTNTIPKEVK